jgi:hypothetical protein
MSAADNEDTSQPSTSPGSRARERALYKPLKEALRHWWLEDRFQKADGEERYVEVAITANASTGLGKWSAPDLTIVSRTTCEFAWSHDFEVITIEVKQGLRELSLESAYEAVAHRRLGTKAFLLVVDPNAKSLSDSVRESQDAAQQRSRPDSARFRDVIKVLRSNGVGLVVARNENDRATWEEWMRSERSPPNPRWIHRLLDKGFSSEADRERLRMLLMKTSERRTRGAP